MEYIIGTVIGAIIALIGGIITAKINQNIVERTTSKSLEEYSKIVIKDLKRTGLEIEAKIGVEVLSKNRQEWINQLRDKSSCYIAMVHQVLQNEEGIRDSDDFLLKLNITKIYIELLLTDEKDGAEIKNIFDTINYDLNIFKQVSPSTTNSDLVTDDLIKFKNQIKKIIKETWDHVKETK